MHSRRPTLAAAAHLSPPREVREIAATLERAGFETWCVGGAVRDALLGLPHLDWDLATRATPPEIKRLFRRTVPIGEQFGTVGVLDRHGVLHEVTTFRRDVHTDGRHAVVEFGASLEDDLARRDFTINAIAYSPARGTLFDPFDGRADLEGGAVRAVGEPRARMAEDRLRALRALRFAGRFDFRIAPETWQAIVESVPFLTRLSRERVKQELEKTMQQVRVPSRSMLLWRTSGALQELLPTLADQPEWALRAADHRALPDDTGEPGHARRRTLIRIATLLVGLSHDASRRTLRDLRFSNRDVDWVAQLATASGAIRPEVAGALGGVSTDMQLRRWASIAGRARLADTLRVVLATLRASGAMGDDAASARALYRRTLRAGWAAPVEIADLAVDGEELMKQGGIAAGPALGEVLRYLLHVVLEDPTQNTRQALISAAQRWVHARATQGEG